MKPKLPILKPQQVVSVFLKAGFVKARQSGSHLVMKNPNTNRIISIPIHVKDIKKGLLSSLIKKSGFTLEDFLKIK